jgi:uncharacterized protein
MRSWTDIDGFDWDDGNRGKNWESHGVTDSESEAVFFNQPLIVRHDAAHSSTEPRWFALGQSDNGRWLFLAFTTRGNRIRVISAREMTRRERRMYTSYEESHSDES